MTSKEARKRVNNSFYAEDPNQLDNILIAIEKAVKDKEFFIVYKYRLTPETRHFLELREYHVGVGSEDFNKKYSVKIQW